MCGTIPFPRKMIIDWHVARPLRSVGLLRFCRMGRVHGMYWQILGIATLGRYHSKRKRELKRKLS